MGADVDAGALAHRAAGAAPGTARPHAHTVLYDVMATDAAADNFGSTAAATTTTTTIFTPRSDHDSRQHGRRGRTFSELQQQRRRHSDRARNPSNLSETRGSATQHSHRLTVSPPHRRTVSPRLDAQSPTRLSTHRHTNAPPKHLALFSSPAMASQAQAKSPTPRQLQFKLVLLGESAVGKSR